MENLNRRSTEEINCGGAECGNELTSPNKALVTKTYRGDALVSVEVSCPYLAKFMALCCTKTSAQHSCNQFSNDPRVNNFIVQFKSTR